MRITKKHLCDLPFCYAVTSVVVDNRMQFIFATDDVGPCYSIDSKTFERKTVWETPGGTMSLVPIPGTEGEFLASQCFFPGFNAPDCRIVHVRFENGAWSVRPWMSVPYLHRFGILSRGGINYLLYCTLAESKKNIDDWSKPGKLLESELPENFETPVELTEISCGMTRNHGFCKFETGNGTGALTGCDEGVFKIIPPEKRGDTWYVSKVLDRRVSDVAVCDIDGDGIDELATIEPFHGTDYVVYHWNGDGYHEMYRYPGKMKFVHVVWGGMLRGEPVFIGGCRALEKEFFMLRWRNGAIQLDLIDSGKGPSNIAVIHGKRKDILLTANRETHEGAIYEVTDGD